MLSVSDFVNETKRAQKAPQAIKDAFKLADQAIYWHGVMEEADASPTIERKWKAAQRRVDRRVTRLENLIAFYNEIVSGLVTTEQFGIVHLVEADE